GRMPLAGFRSVTIVIAVGDVGLQVGKRSSKRCERVRANAGSGFEHSDVRDARVLAQVSQHLGQAPLTWLDDFNSYRPQALSLETLERGRDIPAWFRTAPDDDRQLNLALQPRDIRVAWRRTKRLGFEQIKPRLVRNGRMLRLKQIGRTEHLKLQAAIPA